MFQRRPSKARTNEVYTRRGIGISDVLVKALGPRGGGRGWHAAELAALAHDSWITSLLIIKVADATNAKLPIRSVALRPLPGQPVVAGQSVNTVGRAKGVDPHDVAAVLLDDAGL